MLKLSAPSLSEGVKWLQSVCPELNAESVMTIYGLSGQKPQIARDMIDQGLSQFYVDSVAALCHWLAGNASSMVSAKTLYSKEDLSAPYDILYRATAFALKGGIAPNSERSIGFEALVNALTRCSSALGLIALNRRCIEYKAHALSDHNLNPQLTLEAFLMASFQSDRDLLVEP